MINEREHYSGTGIIGFLASLPRQEGEHADAGEDKRSRLPENTLSQSRWQEFDARSTNGWKDGRRVDRVALQQKGDG